MHPPPSFPTLIKHNLKEDLRLEKAEKNEEFVRLDISCSSYFKSIRDVSYFCVVPQLK